MKALLRSELLRFRRPALFAAAGHLVGLALTLPFDPWTPSMAGLVLAPFLYGLAGLALGLYQLSSYRRLNAWTFLVHRPLSPGRIFLAVAGAGATTLTLVVGLPLLLAFLYGDLLTAGGLDGRQVLVVPYLLGHALACYLAGLFLALAPLRGAILVLCLPVLYLSRGIPGGWVFVPLALVLAWYAFLARRAFKPSLGAPLRGAATVGAVALPMAYALFGLLVAGSAFVWQTWVIVETSGWRSYAVHAWNDHFPEGTVDHLAYLDARAALAHGLAELDTPRGAHLRRQVELAEVAEVVPTVRRSPRRHQPGFLDRNLALADPDNGVTWSFRHDRLRFLGRDQRSGAPVGWLGAGGAFAPGAAGVPAFPEVPRWVGDGWVATEGRLWQLDAGLGRLVLRLTAPAGETLVTPLADHGRFLTALTDRSLLLVRARDLAEAPGEVTAFARVPLPASLDDLERVQVAELLDGYLVSVITGRRSLRGGGEARQRVGELDLDGGFRIVADRELAPSWPALYRYRGFVISPLVQRLHDVARAALGNAPTAGAERGADVEAALLRPVPAAVALAALLVSLAAALTTVLLGRRRGLGGTALAAWTAATALGGAAVLLAFVLVTAPAEPAGAGARSSAVRRRLAALLGRRRAGEAA